MCLVAPYFNIQHKSRYSAIGFDQATDLPFNDERLIKTSGSEPIEN
jgi:hypothetical protein